MKKFLSAVALIVLVAALCAGCGEEKITYRYINQAEGQQMIENNPDVVILDVRTPQEYEVKHIKGAVLLPLDDLRKGDFSKIPDKNATILTYCWTEQRARGASEILVAQGYRNVYEMGGIFDWKGELAGDEIDSGYKHISHEEAGEILASNPKATLIDVRFQKDYDKEHITGAVFVPLEDVLAENFSKIPDKNAPVITYCGNGNRARKTAKALVQKGYTNVYEMGGILDWTGPVECAEEKG